MKNLYLGLAVVGLILPNYMVLMESIETGNILLYADFQATFDAMFASRISSIFMVDLLFAVLVFFIWSWHQSKRHNIHGIYWIWLATMLLGLAFGWPYFLYRKTKRVMQCEGGE